MKNLIKMNQEVKQTIELPEGITAIVLANVAEIKKLQAQVQLFNQKITDVMTGLCLAKEIDFTKETIVFSEDYKSINVYDLPKQEATEPTESVKPTKSKVKKMTSAN